MTVARDVLAEFVVREAREVLLPDGDAELLGVEANVAHIRYRKAHNPKCLECVVSPEDFHDYLMELFSRKAPHIADVKLEVEEQK